MNKMPTAYPAIRLKNGDLLPWAPLLHQPAGVQPPSEVTFTYCDPYLPQTTNRRTTTSSREYAAHGFQFYLPQRAGEVRVDCSGKMI